MPNYWCWADSRPRENCTFNEDDVCINIAALNDLPDPDLPPALVIKQSRKDLRQADAQAGTIGTDRGDFISGA